MTKYCSLCGKALADDHEGESCEKCFQAKLRVAVHKLKEENQ